MLHDLQDPVIDPDQGLVVRVLHGLLDKFHLGVHEGEEGLCVLFGGAMERKGALVGGGDPVELEGVEGEADDADREVGEDAELGDEGRIGKEQDGETGTGEIVEQIKILVETGGLLVNVVVAGDEHALFGGGGFASAS